MHKQIFLLVVFLPLFSCVAATPNSPTAKKLTDIEEAVTALSAPSLVGKITRIPAQSPSSNNSELYRRQSTWILDALLASGVQKIKGLDLHELKNAALEIKWRVPLSGEKIPGFAGERRAAYYHVAGKTVTIVGDPSVYTPDLLSLIALHETLGTLGHNDGNYEISLGFFFLSKTNLDQDWKRAFLIESFIVVAGGGVSVGGGGDVTALTVKANTLARLAEHFHFGPEQLKAFLKIPFEPSWRAEETFVRITFSAKGEPYLVIPAAVWFSVDQAGQNLIAVLATVIVKSIFLENPGELPLAQITCPKAARKLVFRGESINPQTEPTLHKVFEGQNCRIELLR